MVKTRSGKTTNPIYKSRTKRASNFVEAAVRDTNKLSAAAKKANRGLKFGVSEVETGVSRAAKKANRKLASGVGVVVSEVGAVETGVSAAARSANRELASGVGEIETGVSAAARSANRELASGIGAVETGVKDEMDELTHMFNKQKFGGARTKRRRYKKRARSTKKR